MQMPPFDSDEPVDFRLLLKNKPYLFLILTNSVLFFIVSGIQYWATYYFIEVLKVEEKRANILFGTSAITAPIFGALTSSVLSTFFGGFSSKKILPCCLVLSFFGVIFGIAVPESTTILYADGMLWLLLLIGTIMYPMQTGVMLLHVPPHMRPTANSIANLSYNLLGYFPAPIVYGLASKIDGQASSRWGMRSLLYSTVLLPVFIVSAMVAIEMKKKEKSG